jgi:hypothetical protein
MKLQKQKKPKAQTLRLADDHTWTAPEGYKIVMADRGIVIFNVPSEWEVTDFEPFTIRDKAVPDDTMGIQMSCWRLPKGVDWSGLPISTMVAEGTKVDKHQTIIARGEIIVVPREDIELAWTEHHFLDKNEKREAYSRFAIGRGFDAQCLITFSYWVEDVDVAQVVWAEVIRSLQLGQHIANPLKGRTLH